MRFILYFFSALLIVALAVRAWTLSMTWDEAYTVCVYVTDGYKIFSAKDFMPNNHVLHTIFVWLMFQIAPWQEGALRLPALLGGIGTIIILWLLGFFLFGQVSGTNNRKYRNTLLLMAVISLHPLIFQFFSFARGYGLSLFFSLLGFYSLLQFFQSDFDKKCWLVIAGISFGLSVASNLTAAFMNTSIIVNTFCLWFLFGKEKQKMVLPLLFQFCLPGVLIVLVLYAPFFLYVPMEQFNYATETPLDGLLDLFSWTLGNSFILAPESITRLIIGIPIQEDLYWLLLTLTPFTVALPILLIALWLVIPILKAKSKLCPNDLAILLVLGSLLCYAAILCIAWCFGKNLFPKDRTGSIVIAYSLMLPVLLLQHLEMNNIFHFSKWILSVGIVLLIIHFLSLFSYPYYHNIWYADADIREMMKKVQVLSKSPDPPKMLVFTSANQMSIEFYMKKYKINGLELHCIFKKEIVNDLTQFQRHTVFILPAHEAEDAIRQQSKKFQIHQQNRYTGLMLAESSE